MRCARGTRRIDSLVAAIIAASTAARSTAPRWGAPYQPRAAAPARRPPRRQARTVCPAAAGACAQRRRCGGRRRPDHSPRRGGRAGGATCRERRRCTRGGRLVSKSARRYAQRGSASESELREATSNSPIGSCVCASRMCVSTASSGICSPARVSTDRMRSRSRWANALPPPLPPVPPPLLLSAFLCQLSSASIRRSQSGDDAWLRWHRSAARLTC